MNADERPLRYANRTDCLCNLDARFLPLVLKCTEILNKNESEPATLSTHTHEPIEELNEEGKMHSDFDENLEIFDLERLDFDDENEEDEVINRRMTFQ